MAVASRSHVLPSNTYNGQIGGVGVSYNQQTQNSVKNLGSSSSDLKQLLEDSAVKAALSRGFVSVLIRSTPHTTTKKGGVKVRHPIHMTISCGQVQGHVYFSGFDVTNYPNNLYKYMAYSRVKWDDRATSSNGSSGARGDSSSNASSSGRR